MANALAVKSYISPECSMCSGNAPAKVRVVGNPEIFCGLQCCRIYYSRPNEWIREQRRNPTYKLEAT